MQNRNQLSRLNGQATASFCCSSGILRMALAALLLLGTNLNMATGQSPSEEAGSIFAAAKKAIAEGKLGKMPAKDFGLAKKGFTDCPPEGMILVGLELGLGKVGKNTEMIYALRPIYQNQQGNHVYFQEFGAFKDKTLANGKFGKSKVTHIMQLKAKSGYAVGEIYLKVGKGINALSVTYMRISGQLLDPKQQYSSHWYGDPSSGTDVALGGNGLPLVGVFGHQNDQQILALGVFYIDKVSDSANAKVNSPGENNGTNTTGPIPGVTPNTDPRTGRETPNLVNSSPMPSPESSPENNAVPSEPNSNPVAGKSQTNNAKEPPAHQSEETAEEDESFNKITLICGLLTVSGMSVLVIFYRRFKKRKLPQQVQEKVNLQWEANGVPSQKTAPHPVPARLPALPKSESILGNRPRF